MNQFKNENQESQLLDHVLLTPQYACLSPFAFPPFELLSLPWSTLISPFSFSFFYPIASPPYPISRSHTLSPCRVLQHCQPICHSGTRPLTTVPEPLKPYQSLLPCTGHTFPFEEISLAAAFDDSLPFVLVYRDRLHGLQ